MSLEFYLVREHPHRHSFFITFSHMDMATSGVAKCIDRNKRRLYPQGQEARYVKLYYRAHRAAESPSDNPFRSFSPPHLPNSQRLNISS